VPGASDSLGLSNGRFIGKGTVCVGKVYTALGTSPGTIGGDLDDGSGCSSGSRSMDGLVVGIDSRDGGKEARAGPVGTGKVGGGG
jgi:hypothetical protein